MKYKKFLFQISMVYFSREDDEESTAKVKNLNKLYRYIKTELA